MQMKMKSIYTTTITDEAKRRGIKIEVLDGRMPVFVLRKGHRSVRCFNALTDRVGAASFLLTQNKASANSLLRRNGVPVPVQMPYTSMHNAVKFLKKHKCIVVKPAAQWGGRGVSVDIRTVKELADAVGRARCCEEDVLLEQCVRGEDYRLIFVGYRYVAAIRRSPATVVGNGRSTVKELIVRFNSRERKVDASHQVPLDRETERALNAGGISYRSIPAAGAVVRVRMNSNYHTGGAVEVVTGAVDKRLIAAAGKIAKLVAVPVIGIDFLCDRIRGRYWVIELSPDLAISPPEGAEVAKRFLDYLFGKHKV